MKKTRKMKNFNKCISAKNEKNGRKKTIFSFSFCKFVFVGILLWVVLRETTTIYQMFSVDKYGIEATATVYKTTRKRGRRTLYFVYYEYPVKRRWYKAKELMDKKEYSKGDTIRIKYLPKEPEVNFTVNDIDYHKKILPFWD